MRDMNKADNKINKTFRDFSREIEGLPADVLRGLRSPVISRNDDPDERPVDPDEPIITTRRTIAEFEGRISQLEDDAERSEAAMRAAYAWANTSDGDVAEWSRVVGLLKSALRI